jgi:PAS domain S-box-containing protein
MVSTDTPMLNNEIDVNNCLAEAQAALETLRSLQNGLNELNSDSPSGFEYAKAALDQAQRALERVSLALNNEQDRRLQAERGQDDWEQRFRAITQDISALKHQEEQILQLNHTLKALSNSNQAMLHAENETDFLNEVCRIIVEDCDFALVWIGYSEKDKQKSVRPVASAGFEQGYLENLNITWADTERGRGPTGTAIRTKKPSRCNNMLTDPRFTPWREAAIKRGYASSLVLPLLSGDRAFGALNIYSKEPDGFSDAEEKLLVELAGDLAYGIMTLRLKADQARTEQAIHLSEQRYRTLFKHMTEGFSLHEIICDEQGAPRDFRFLEINPAFEQLTGLKRKKVLGKLASQVLPGLEPSWIEKFGKVALTGQPIQFEDYTGTLRRYYRVLAFTPAPGQFAVLFMDVTGQKQVQEALLLSEEKYRTMVETAAEGIVMASPDGKYFYANQQMADMLGYSVEEILGKSGTDFVFADQQTLVHQLRAELKSGNALRGELKFRRSDGSVLWSLYNASPIFNDKGEHVANLAMHTDITARKQIETQLASVAKKYATLFNNTSDGICIYNLDGVILEANEAYCQMSGYTCDELTQMHVFTLEVSETPEDVSHRVQKLLDQKGHDSYESQHRCKDGSIIDVDVTALYFEQDGGRIANFVRDITERKLVEQRLAYLASFPEVNPRPITEVDLHGLIHYANPAAMKLFPDLKEKGKNHPWLVDWDTILHPILNGQVEVSLRDVAIGDRYYQQSLNYIASQELVRIYGLDITEHKRAEQALRQAHDELEHKVLERTQELNIANEQLRGKIIEHQKVQNELESSLQELQVIEEELRNNNEMLIDAQKVLDTERQRYQDLFDFAPDGYLVTDGNGLILDANQNATQLLGIPYHSLIGKPFLVFISQADQTSFHHLLSNLRHEQSLQSQELRLLPRTGSEVSIAVTVASAKDPSERDTLRWTLRDITERRHAEEIIRQNSLRNAALSEVSQSLAVASLDEHAIVDIVVKTAARSIGDGCVISLLAEDGKHLNAVAWHHNQPEMLKLMDGLLTSNQSRTLDGLSERVYETSMPVLIQNMDDVVLDLLPEAFRRPIKQVDINSLLIVPLQISNKTIGAISLLRGRGSQLFTKDDQAVMEILANRTAQTIHNARLYQELQKALQKELETHDQLVQAEKFAAVGRLLASITHEINNPLQTIKNCLYLSQMDTAPDTPAYDALSMATTETNRLSNLVAQLREIYRPPTHGLSRPVQLPTLLGEVQTLLAGYLLEKHVVWQLVAPSSNLFEGVEIEGVPDQLKQVFLNICINAIDAMEPDGGTITISFKRSAEDDRLGICIRDTGPGLTQEVKDKLFEPFTTTKEKGLGLGLVICYDIIQKHHGSIEVESEPGEGATFTVWLPARKQEL